MGLSETVLAAMIGAVATIGTALFQLISSWRAQTGDRRASRGGLRSLMMLFAIMLASAVAGYAYSEYRSDQSREDTRAARQELQQQLRLLETSTARLEQVRLNAQSEADDQARLAEERRRGARGVEAMALFPVCKGSQIAFSTERAGCTEGDARSLALCALVPAQAQVSEVQLFVRPESSQSGWSDSRVTSGQDAGGARFIDAPFERPHHEGSKQVCATLTHWASDAPRMARIVVRYTL